MATTDNAPDFDPTQLTNYLQSAKNTSAHNVAMKAAFRKLEAAVKEFAVVFADDYKAPEPKERAKRGTGKAAQAKAAAAAVGNADAGTKKAGRPKKGAAEPVDETTATPA